MFILLGGQYIQDSGTYYEEMLLQRKSASAVHRKRAEAASS